MENQNNFNTNTFVAASVNGFTSFQNRIVSDVTHVTAPIPQFQNGYAGDYIGITANGGRGFAAWMDDRNGTWQNYISEVRTADINLTGSSQFCINSTYTLTGVPPGANVIWQAPVPAGIANIASNGNSATLTRSVDGIVTLSAQVIDGGCDYGIFSIPVTVGAPALTITTSRNSFCSNGYQTWTLSAAANSGSNWSWTVGNLGTNSQILIFNPSSPTTQVDVKGGGAVRLNYTDLCGAAKLDGITVYSSCPPTFLLAPNPTQGNVNISSTSTSSKDKTVPSDVIYKIKITDRLGGIRKTFEYKTPIHSTNISIAGIESGIYTISVFDGLQWGTQELLIK
jgi:bacillolysin